MSSYTRGRGYFARAKRGRSASRGGSRGGGTSDGGQGQPAPKKRKFNPFFRARGSWKNRYQVNLPASVSVRLETNEQIDAASDDEMNGIVAAPLVATQLLPDCFGNDKFPRWKLYYPTTEYDPKLPILITIKAFEEYFQKYLESSTPKDEEIEFYFEDNYFILKYDILQKKFDENFMDNFKESPVETLNAAACAMEQVLRRKNEFPEMKMYILRAELSNFKQLTRLGDAMNTLNIDTLIKIRGTVMRVSDPETYDLWQVYECEVCAKRQVVYQPDGVKIHPTHCYGGCRNRSKWDYVLKSPMRAWFDTQNIRLQESTAVSGTTSNQLNYIQCVAKHQLVNWCRAGDDIFITGVLRAVEESNFKKENVIKQFIEVLHFDPGNNCVSAQRTKLTETDMEAIDIIKRQPSVLRLLVNSLNPEIYGNELVKAGLILSLFGGSSHSEVAQSRSNIHCLMIGDPGLGKSELLNSCMSVSPKGIYSVATNLSSAGLTAGVRRAEDRFVIDAGALVMADGGICCIDEIDKKVQMHSDLLDAMERQKVSVVKVGTRVNLAARTTIIAAGNPTGNFYNKNKSIKENIKISSALLSRFDLVFIMTSGDEEFNQNLSNWRFNQKNYEPVSTKNEFQRFLQLKKGEFMDLLPHPIFMNYIGYARKNSFPRIPQDVAEVLEEFYYELRRMYAASELSITIRQLEGLRRLATARARIDCAEVVTMNHAKEIIELSKFCYLNVFETETGELDISRGVQGSGLSQRSKKMKFFSVLKESSRVTGQTAFSMAQMKQIANNMQMENVQDVVDSLNLNGFLLMQKKGDKTVYKIVNV